MYQVLEYFYRYFSNTSRADDWKNDVSHHLFSLLFAIEISIIVIVLIIVSYIDTN